MQEGTCGAAGKIDFIYGASGMIGFEKDGTRYFYRRNLMGDVTHIYNEVGTLFAEYVYDAWGNYRIKTDIDGIGTLNPIRYRGYYYDTETGLYYLRARYYDPETGRFISQDDVSYLTPTRLSGLNLYAYCGNNPVMGYDPSGCFDWGTFWDIALYGVAVVAGIAVGALTGNFWLGLATIGLVNNAVNFVYYTFISDGKSDLNGTSYHGKYLNRWERLDHAKHKTQQSWYNFNAWMYHSEYSFHAWIWWITGWAYVEEGSEDKKVPIFSWLAEKSYEASVSSKDPLADFNENKNLEGIARIIAYIVWGIFGL